MQRKKSKLSIFSTQALFYLLIIIIILSIFGTLFFSTAKAHLEGEIGRKLKDIASIAARNAPTERLELIKLGDDQTRMVLRLKEKLSEIREATGVESVFIFRPDGTSIVDPRPEYIIGATYMLSHFEQAFYKELQEGRSVNTVSYRAASGELFISAYAPIMNTRGRLYAIVGVDAGTKEIEVIEKMRSRLYWIAGLSAVFAFLFALLLARSLAKPIRNMAKTAEQIGDGDYTARVAIPQVVELEILANSINKMAQQVQARDARLKEMSANVAHEIRNPLNSIKLLLAVLGEEMQEQNASSSRKTIETLNYEIGKLNRFLTEFLTYSRPMTLLCGETAPADLAAKTVEMTAAAAEEKGVIVHLQPEADLPLICVDRDRMEQSLLNVLLNAIEASDDGGRVVMSIRLRTEDQTIDFAVEDSGHGIAESALQQIFEPFFTTKQSGTGLGLANAEKIVRDHGGVIVAENIPNGGARIIVRLPVNQARTEDK